MNRVIALTKLFIKGRAEVAKLLRDIDRLG